MEGLANIGKDIDIKYEVPFKTGLVKIPSDCKDDGSGLLPDRGISRSKVLSGIWLPVPLLVAERTGVKVAS